MLYTFFLWNGKLGKKGIFEIQYLKEIFLATLQSILPWNIQPACDTKLHLLQTNKEDKKQQQESSQVGTGG